MIRSPKKLSNEIFDIAIIGGGITGACLAADASLRGLSVALIEKNDFGAKTSAASSKLLHGGIRYLQQGQLSKVRESALERTYFQRLAPHLTHYIPFVVPTFKEFKKSKLFMTAGMLAYQALCTGQNRLIEDPSKQVPSWKYVSSEELTQNISDFQQGGTTGGVLFYESHMISSERMTLAFLETAAEHGATIGNYIEAQSFLHSGQKIIGVYCADLIAKKNFELRAKIIVNAAGPWIPLLNETMPTKNLDKIVTGFSKGAHIVTTKITESHAIALTTSKKHEGLLNRGGRHVFIIPWRNHSLIGTTYDAYHDNLNDVRPTEENINDLITDINSAFGCEKLTRDAVKYAYAGIYPLITDKINPNKYQGTGEYQIIDHKNSEGFQGLYSVFGAKYTTARLLAEKALNIITKDLDKPIKPCATRNTQLTTGNINNIIEYRLKKKQEYATIASSDTIDHLVTYYGTAIDQIMEIAKTSTELAKPVMNNQHSIIAEIIFTIRNEMVFHLDDFIFRRTGIGTLGNPGDKVLSNCASIMADEFGWDEQRTQTEINNVKKYYRYH